MVTPRIPLPPGVRDQFSRAPLWPDLRITDLTDMLQDATVGTALAELTVEALADPFTVRSEPADPDLETALIDAGLIEWCRVALGALGRGLSLQQQRWDRIAGRLRVTDCLEIDADRVALQLDRFGQVTAVAVDTSGDARRLMTAPEALLHRHEASACNPCGRTRLSRAYRSWLARNDLITQWGTAITRNGGPVIMARYPAASSVTDLSAWRAEIEAASVSGGAMFPDTLAIEALQPSYATTLSIGEALHYMDAQIRYAIALRWASGTLLGRDTAYNAEATYRAEPHGQLIARIRDELGRTLTTQMLTPLHVANYGTGARAWIETPLPEVAAQTTTPASGATA